MAPRVSGGPLGCLKMTYALIGRIQGCRMERLPPIGSLLANVTFAKRLRTPLQHHDHATDD